MKNQPGRPIATRERGATFYCLSCGRTYQKCQCRAYVSVDTLKDTKTLNQAISGAANGIPEAV